MVPSSPLLWWSWCQLLRLWSTFLRTPCCWQSLDLKVLPSGISLSLYEVPISCRWCHDYGLWWDSCQDYQIKMFVPPFFCWGAQSEVSCGGNFGHKLPGLRTWPLVPPLIQQWKWYPLSHLNPLGDVADHKVLHVTITVCNYHWGFDVIRWQDWTTDVFFNWMTWIGWHELDE